MSLVVTSRPCNYVLCNDVPIELTIGLEVHAQLNSSYKLFSGHLGASTTLDLGLPGSLPIMGIDDVLGINALASALCSRLSGWVLFTRKGYFCADLALGYQITQYHNPLLVYGTIWVYSLTVSGACRVALAHIQSVNLEHDTGSVSVLNNQKLVSYLRAGISLLEFVSFPCFDSVLAVKLCLLKLKLILLCLRVSSCVMAHAEMRYDFNISVSAPLTAHSARTEIKNLNSLSGLNQIVLSEVSSIQRARYSSTKTIQLRTFAVFFLRKKESAREYKRLLEADVPCVRLQSNRACACVCALRGRHCVFWVLSCGIASYFCFYNTAKLCCRAHVLSRFGFSVLSLLLRHASIV
ncbi:hypothetical protein AADW59_00590 [Candidatus Hodgkinia cicadicola]